MNPDLDVDRFCRTLIHDMPDAVIYADGEGVIRFWNAGAERIIGIAAAEAVGQSLALIIPENLRARHRKGDKNTKPTGNTRYDPGDNL